MNQKKISLLNNGLIWFGAAVSISEIMTGALLAPLGFSRAALALVLGHVIGCFLLCLAGMIGAETGSTAMETVKISFGVKGSQLFAVLNVLQLVGWTAVMIVGGAQAASEVSKKMGGAGNVLWWSVILGLLILLWILIGIKNLGKVNIVAMGALFILTVILSFVVFKSNSQNALITEKLTFGAGVELSAAMPLSWLPLISDYTSCAEKPKKSAIINSAVYFVSSCFMYFIGLGAAVFTGKTDIGQIMAGAGLGVAGMMIVLFSTTTTTFLDVYSAGVSFTSLTKRFSQKNVSIVICLAGTLLAMLVPVQKFENFLYLIGSVFAPMIAILVTDFFILKKDSSQRKINVTNLVLWVVGFILYRLFLHIDTGLGSTIPVMLLTAVLCILVNGGKNYVRKSSSKCS